MTLGFPTNTVAAIIAAMIGAGVGAWFSVAYGLRQLPFAPRILRRWRWGAAMVIFPWLLVVVATAVIAPGNTVVGAPYIITSLGLGLLAGMLPLLISPTFRQLIRAIPATWLIGIHTIRILGFLFLALMDMHLLPGAFALPAGYGDITVGLLALGLVYLFTTWKPGSPSSGCKTSACLHESAVSIQSSSLRQGQAAADRADDSDGQRPWYRVRASRSLVPSEAQTPFRRKDIHARPDT